MKKILLLAVIVVSTAISSYAQSLEVGAQAGWFWSSNYNTGIGQLGMKANNNFNVHIGMPEILGENRGLEFSYSSVSSFIKYSNYYTPDFEDLNNADVTMDYYMISGIQSIDYTEAIEPFGMFGLGIANGQIRGYTDTWNFSVGFGVGTKIHLSEMIGLRLQARLLAPMNFGGVGIFCGSGSGCGTGVSTYSSVLQGDFSGGLFLTL